MAYPPRPPDVPVTRPPAPYPVGPPVPASFVDAAFARGEAAARRANPNWGQPTGPKPIWAMNSQELQDYAFKQAQAFYQPILDELHRQQHDLEIRNAGSKQGLLKLIEAVQGSARGLGDETGRGLGDAFAGLAGQAGQEQFLTVSQDQNRAMQDLIGQIMQVTGQIPGQAQDILHDLQGQVAEHQKASAPIIRSVGGSLVAIDPTSGKTQVLYQKPESERAPTVRTIGGFLYQYDNGRWVKVAGTGPTAQSKTVGGYIYERNPDTGQWEAVGGPGPKAASPGKFQHVAVAGKQYVFDPNSGTFYDPATGQPIVPKNSPAKGVTPATIAKGWKLINQVGRPHWIRAGGDDTPLSTSQLRSILNTFNSTTGKAEGITLTIADLKRLTPEQAAAVGITRSQGRPDTLYLRLVREIGVPSRRAWQMVRKLYPDWGKGYYRPKAEAAQGAAFGAPIPLAAGKLIGFPNQGSHTLYGNWQSDNAVDFSAPVGTPIYAVADGTIGPRIGPFSSQDPHLSGSRVTLIGAGNQFYYAHLSRLAVKAGQKVKKGQLIGYSGSANGVNHLHFGVEHGNPADYFHGGGEPGTRSLAGGNSVKDYAFHQAAQYGWGTDELKALNQLWQKESGWNYKARNSGSGALGIPQALGHTLPPGYENDPQIQINWGLQYIKSRYKTPSRAWAFWQATVNRNANLAPADLRRTARIWIRNGWGGY